MTITPALLSGDFNVYNGFGSCENLTPILEGDNVPATVSLTHDQDGWYSGTEISFTSADAGVTAGTYTVKLTWYFESHIHQQVSSANIEI